MRCKACNADISGWRNKRGVEEDLCSRCLVEVRDTIQWMDYCSRVYGDASVTESVSSQAFANAYAQEHADLQDESDEGAWPDVLTDSGDPEGNY